MECVKIIRDGSFIIAKVNDKPVSIVLNIK